MDGDSHKQLGQQLIDADLITQEQLDRALDRQRTQGRNQKEKEFLGKILLDMKLITDDQLAEFLVRQCRVPFVKLSVMSIPQEILSILPKDLACRFRVIPIERLKNILSVAMVNPMDRSTIEEIEKTTGTSVRPFICTNGDMDSALREHYGEFGAVDGVSVFQGDSAVEQALEATPEAVAVAQTTEALSVIAEITEEDVLRDGILVPDYTFASFVQGRGNDFTCAICRAVAEHPGSSYNPVYIHGNCGLGKTHLLHAIGNEVKRRNPSAKVSYRSIEQFASEMIEAVQTGRLEEFRRFYGERDVLLLDDIQFLAGEESAQNEFISTFEVLYQSKKQIVITSDRHPDAIQVLREKLHTQFASGVITDVRAPDVDTRHAILKSIAKRYDTPISDEVLGIIAERISSNVRELEGCLKKMIAFSTITDEPVSMAMAEGVLAKFGKASKRESTVAPAPEPELSSSVTSDKVDGADVASRESQVLPKAASQGPISTASPDPKPVTGDAEAKQKMQGIRKQFSELLKVRLQKAKSQDDLKTLLVAVLSEAKPRFEKTGDRELAGTIAHALELAEQGEVKNAVVLMAKACKE